MLRGLSASLCRPVADQPLLVFSSRVPSKSVAGEMPSGDICSQPLFVNKCEIIRVANPACPWGICEGEGQRHRERMEITKAGSGGGNGEEN